ncbi:MAG: hypothetical protein AUI14_13865 [Actinobacteria bacterium 13_2_20CM_2_71_6]|nr:MAG: hypothetical protein AUI14_13865 [Actinobacteria bacterium 13_2_20CM_2_71_6]
MTTAHPSPARHPNQVAVATYRRISTDSSPRSVQNQAAHLRAWLTTHGLVCEIFYDTDEPGPQPTDRPTPARRQRP